MRILITPFMYTALLATIIIPNVLHAYLWDECESVSLKASVSATSAPTKSGETAADYLRSRFVPAYKAVAQLGKADPHFNVTTHAADKISTTLSTVKSTLTTPSWNQPLLGQEFKKFYGLAKHNLRSFDVGYVGQISHIALFIHGEKADGTSCSLRYDSPQHVSSLVAQAEDVKATRAYIVAQFTSSGALDSDLKNFLGSIKANRAANKFYDIYQDRAVVIPHLTLATIKSFTGAIEAEKSVAGLDLGKVVKAYQEFCGAFNKWNAHASKATSGVTFTLGNFVLNGEYKDDEGQRKFAELTPEYLDSLDSPE